MQGILDRIAERYAKQTERPKTGKGSMSLYQRLYNLVKDGIVNNDIPEGSALPATRLLADELGLSRTTVIRAYELLRLEGYIDSKVGSGHIIRRIQDNALPATEVEVEEGLDYPDLSETGKSFLKNISLINSTDDKSIAFRPGLPPLDIFPVNQWKNLSNLYWRYVKSSALSYSPSSGIDQLKKNLATYLNLTRGIKCDHRQIILVSGSLQSLYLVGNTVINPGDKMIMENPTFPNVYSIFKGLRADIQPVGLDDEGMKVSDMDGEAFAGSKLLHCTPSCHYPTGTQMSLQRRKDLLKWADKQGSFVIENDYEHEVHNYGRPMPSLYSLDQQQRVIYMSTFNRLLHPSIRIGFMVLPFYLLNAVEALLKHSHRFVSPAVQVVLNQFIEKHYLHNHVKKVVEVAEEREQIFSETFRDHFGDAVTLRKNSTRSLQLLAELHNGVKDSEVVAMLASQSIIAHAYSKCFVGEPKKQGLILGYSSVRPPVIRQKIGQMAKVYPKVKR